MTSSGFWAGAVLDCLFALLTELGWLLVGLLEPLWEKGAVKKRTPSPAADIKMEAMPGTDGGHVETCRRKGGGGGGGGVKERKSNEPRVEKPTTSEACSDEVKKSLESYLL